MSEEPPLKPVVWVGSSRNDLRALTDPVQDHMGYAIYVAQRGGKHRDAKVLSGFGGAGVLEVVKDFRGDSFRAVYTLRYAGGCLRAPSVSEEIEVRARDTAARYRANRKASARG
jgi:phage-related protein